MKGSSRSPPSPPRKDETTPSTTGTFFLKAPPRRSTGANARSFSGSSGEIVRDEAHGNHNPRGDRSRGGGNGTRRTRSANFHSGHPSIHGMAWSLDGSCPRRHSDRPVICDSCFSFNDVMGTIKTACLQLSNGDMSGMAGYKEPPPSIDLISSVQWMNVSAAHPSSSPAQPRPVHFSLQSSRCSQRQNPYHLFSSSHPIWNKTDSTRIQSSEPPFRGAETN